MGPRWQLPGPAQPDQPRGFQAFYQVCQKLLNVRLSIVSRCIWHLAFVSSIKALPSLNHIASSHPFLSSAHRKNQDEIVHIEIQNSGDYYDLYRNEKVTMLGDVVGYYMENPGTLREENGRVIELRNALNCEEVVTTERWACHIASFPGSPGMRVCVGESLVSFLRKHDVIKIGPKQKGNVFVHCSTSYASTLGVYDIQCPIARYM